MIDLTVVLIGFHLIAGTQDSGRDALPVDLAEVRKRIETVVEKHFREAPEAARRVYVDRLTAPFAVARIGARAGDLLDHLDAAALFHRVRVVDQQAPPLSPQDPALPPFPVLELPPDLLKDGFDIQVEYFAARIERALEPQDTPETRKILTEQISSLCDRVEARLKDILPGTAGNDFARGKVEEVRSTWLASLDLPLHAFLDRPLSPAQQEAVFRAIDRAGTGPPLVVTESDLADANSPLRSQAQARVEQLLEAAATATSLCYASLSPHEERTQKWTLSAQNWIAGKTEGALAQAAALWNAARSGEAPPKKRDAAPSHRAESGHKPTSSATGSPPVHPAAKPAAPPARSPSPLLWVLAAGALLFGIAVLRNRLGRAKR